MEQYIGMILDNRYELLEVIGMGGMAVVYKAMDRRLNRLVAIKVLKSEYFNDADFRRRFHAESQAVAMMSHPNIVNVFDVSKNDGVDYIVMELIDGITLKQYMERKGTLSWRETLHFAMQIAKALEHAHSRNIIHRDIKPHNIMILKDGSVKVADFGIAQIASAQNTLTKEALGSVHYISPEQAKGARVDARSDIYSLGVVMYQMLTGRTPYDGDSPVSVAIQHINGTPLLPSLLVSNIPTGLEQITMHAMCSDIGKRYASASDMLRDMEEFRKNPGVVFSFASDGSTEAVTRPPLQGGASGRQNPPRQIRRATAEDYAREDIAARKRILLTALVAFVGVVIIGLAGYFVFVKVINPSIRYNHAIELMDAGDYEEAAAIFEELGSYKDSQKQLELVRSREDGAEEVPVPNLIGRDWDTVNPENYPGLSFRITEESYIYNSVYPMGTVCDQSIRPDTLVPSGTVIDIKISKGDQSDTMPDFTGKSLDYVELYLKSMTIELNIQDVVEEYDDQIESGKVLRTIPVPGSTLKNGDKVTIFVSNGKEPLIKVPDLYDMELDEAKKLIEENKLEYYIVGYEESNVVEADHVLSQTPSANEEVREHTIINLTISKGKKTEKVPSVVGMHGTLARQTLEDLGFVVITQNTVNAEYQPGYVCAQEFPEGTELELGQTITIYISSGPLTLPTTDPSGSGGIPIPTSPGAPGSGGKP